MIKTLLSTLRRNWLTGLILALLLVGSGGAWAQTSANYAFSTAANGSLALDRNSNAVDMTIGTTQLVAATSDDVSSAVVALPFNFVLLGRPFTQFSATSNGLVGLGGAAPTTITYTVPTGTAATPLIAAFAADLSVGPVGKVHYKTVGTAPNRTLVVEFLNMSLLYLSTPTNDGTYQVRLYEGTGIIEFVYGVMSRNAGTGASSATVGIGFAAGSTATTQVSVISSTNVGTNNSATYGTNTYTANSGAIPNLNSAANGARRVYTFVPPQAVVAAPTPLSFSSVGYTGLKVSFVDNSTNETDFAVLRSTDNVTFTLVGLLASPSTAATGTGYTFIFTGLTPGTTYYYQLVAITEGVPSTTVSGTQATPTLPTSLSGTFTIDNTSATNTSGNFNSFTDAITALNQASIAGAITFNVSNSQTFNETPPVITATGTSTNTITFQETALTPSVYTDNPKITPTGTAGANDGGLVIAGGDYFTFDGISVDASVGTAVEYGYLVRNATATNGALNNTFRNAAITLNRSNTTAAGVLQSASTTYGGAVAATATSGTNQNNAYYNLQIRNAYVGVRLYSTSTGFPDYNTQLYNCTIGDPATAGDIGGGSTTAYGVHAYVQSKLSLHDNTVRNVLATSTTTFGILVEQAMGTGTDASNVYNNKVSTVRNSSASSTSAATGLGASMMVTGIHTLNIYNNFIFDITHGFTGTATLARYVRGIYLTSSSTSGTQTFNVSFNSVRLETPATYMASSSCFEITSASAAVVNTRDNIFSNFSTSPTGLAAKHFTWVSTSGSAIGGAGSVSNYNDLYIANQSGASGFVALGNATTYTTIVNWRTATSQEANSLNADPAFTSATDLHTLSPALNAAATPISGVTTDIDGDTRDALTPDIGADEFTPPMTFDLKPVALLTPATAQTCFGSAEAVIVQIQNNGGVAIDFTSTAGTVTATVTGVATATLTGTLTSGTLAAGATQNVVMTPTLDMSAYGAYTFTISATVSGDQNTANDALTPSPVITTAAPVAGTLSPASAAICQSGTAMLVLAGAANNTIQYQSSPDGTTFTDVSGATSATYTTPVLTSTTFFRAQTRCGVNSATSNVATITVNNPLITGTNTPVVICPSSSATLMATANAGSTIRWYDTNASTTVLATGGAYATPVLTASRQYFVVAVVSNGSTNTTGLPSNAATYGTYSQSTLTDYPLGFKVTQPGMLASVDVYPTVAGALTVRLYATASPQPAAAGAQVGSDVTITVTAAQVGTKVTVPLSISLAVGDYKLTNTAGAVGRFSTYSGTYPLSSGPISVLGSYVVPSSTTFSNISYNSFFNLAFTTDCASARTAVQVNVTPVATANAGTAPAGVCAGTTYSTTGSFGGSATSATYTSSGSGAFSNAGVINSTTTSVTYSPSTADITAGSVTLTLTTSGPCAAATSTLLLTINSATTYTGTATGDGNNWFNAANWTACVPGSTVDVIIPTGLTNYPNLSTTATAEVRSLTLNNGASLAQSAGTLNVYSNLISSTPAANVALTGGGVAFVGPMPTVTGLSSLYNLAVSLNSAAGTLTLANNVTVTHALTLTQGTLTTGPYAVALAPSATATETDASYVLGQVTVSGRTLSTATAETFGNIGLTLTPDAASTAFPGLTTVVRTTGTALTGAGSSASVKRWFRVTPTVDANLTMTLKMDLFEHERNGIVNGNLLLFSSPIPAGGGSPATTTWTPSAASAPVTPSNAAYATAIAISGLTHLSDWTLGNRANPLPVTLAAFTADRQGTNAALAWTTASEKSSRGFEVQASPDGRVFRVLDFVASSTPTSTSPRYYSYLDREAGKTGIRYYRLRQVDLNGTATFSSVRTVRFDGESVLRLTAAPNPFKERLTLTVELPVGAAAAPAQLSLTDAVGRTLLTQLTPALAAGLSQLELTDLAKLASGVYFVNLTVPGQTIQHLKVVKE